MRQLIVGNWKMNGLTEQAAAIAGAVRRGADGLACDLVVCPPFTMLHLVSHLLVGSAVEVGAQDCHARSSGAHTGDISAAMLRDVGARWVILAHSERRATYGETDAVACSKAEAAAAFGITPIICVGETQAEREAGEQDRVVAAQLAGSLPPQYRGAIAYEPIWAIGSGRAATIADVAAMHLFIRRELRRHLGPAGDELRILYGGSVKPDNAAELLAAPEVGGALVGGASLNGADFLAIARASTK